MYVAYLFDMLSLNTVCPLAGGRERGPPSLFELRRGLAAALAEADAPASPHAGAPIARPLRDGVERPLFLHVLLGPSTKWGGSRTS